MNPKTSRCARLFACAVVLLSAVSGVYSASGGEQVPFKGNASGMITGVVPGPGGVLFSIHASGNATQLGNFQRDEELLLDPNTGAFTGTIVYTAANGDLLYTTMVGQFTSPTTAVGTYTIAGGTGRFVGATGGAAFQAATPDGLHVNVTFSGTISRVGG